VEVRKQNLTTSKIESGKNANHGALDLFHAREIKEVLIKSVAQAILSYYMGAFLLPSTLCYEI